MLTHREIHTTRLCTNRPLTHSLTQPNQRSSAKTLHRSGGIGLSVYRLGCCVLKSCEIIDMTLFWLGFMEGGANDGREKGDMFWL
mmetsp:Transcript_48723/g.122007  ORF Transcript_48723/g.122007 Transcript_48723/m.122007 type:complete len:85 (+) Transcript_48723:47-301(+)